MAKKKQEEVGIFDVDHKVLAGHFGKTRENMLVAKKRYFAGEKSMWEIYCKAYQWDMLKEKLER